MHKQITFFISLSALIHGAIWFFASNQQADSIIKEQGSSPLSLELITDSGIPASSRINKNLPTPAAKPEDKPTAQSVKTPATTQAVTTSHKPQQIPDLLSSKAAEKSTQASSASPDIEKVSQIISLQLKKHFYYPRVAQRRNWQGQVILAFTIMPGGLIQHIHIQQSSGYEVLDDAALDALQKVKPSQDLALALNGSSLQQQLPITYKLASR